MNDLKSIGAKAFIWDFSGKIATHGTGFIVSIFLARLLEPSDFGLIAIVLVIIGIASVFTDVGLSAALIQRKKLLQVHYTSVFYFNIFIGLFLTLITCLSAEWIGYFYNSNELVGLAQAMSLLFIINAFGSVQNTKLRRELKYAVLTKAVFIASLVSGVIGVSLAFYGAGVWSLVAQALLSGILYNVFIWSRSGWTPSYLFSFKALVKLWGFGAHIFLASLLDTIFTKLDYLVIGKLFPIATLGFFVRAKSLNAMVVEYSSGSLMEILFPVLSKVKNDLPRFCNIVIRMMGIICFIAFLLLGGLFVISEELIILLFGEKWFSSVNYFQLFLLSGFGYPVSALLVNVLISRGNSKEILRIQIYKNVIGVVNLLVLLFFGIEGYLYGLIVVVVIGVIININSASREIKVPFIKFAKPIIVQATISIVATVITMYMVVLLGLQEIGIFSLLFKGIIFVSIYFMVNWIFKTNSYCVFIDQFVSLRSIGK